MTDQRTNRFLSAAESIAGVRILSDPAGMARLTLSEVRLSPGSDSVLRASIGTTSSGGEAFIYVLDGRGTLILGEQRLDIMSGDFIGLANGEQVTVLNSSDAELAYFCGGEKS